MYSKQQKEAALKLYKQSKSVSETVRILGYPTRKQLYNWVYEEKHPTKNRQNFKLRRFLKEFTQLLNSYQRPREDSNFRPFA